MIAQQRDVGPPAMACECLVGWGSYVLAQSAIQQRSRARRRSGGTFMVVTRVPVAPQVTAQRHCSGLSYVGDSSALEQSRDGTTA